MWFSTQLYMKALMPCIYVTAACIFAYLGIETEWFAILTVLLVLDFFTWVIKARFINEKITSKRMRLGSIKKLILLIVPIVVALMFKATGVNWDKVLLGFIGILCVAEWYSIFANVVMIRTGQRYNEFDAVTFVLKKVADYIQSRLDKRMDLSPPK